MLMLTLGTGIGSALFRDGVLVPNTELGHLQIRGKDAERRAAASIKERKGLSWQEWSKLLSEYLEEIDALLWPDLVIIGGGISKDADRFINDLPRRVRCVPATLLNRAGIVGAAMLAAEAAQLTAPHAAGRGCLVARTARRPPARPGARRERLPPDRAPRRDRRPAHRRARRQRGHDRLVLPRALRRAEHVRRDPRHRKGRALRDPPDRRGVHDQAALPSRHGGAGDALLHRGRRRRGRRLHAARGQLHDHPPHRGRARLAALRRPLPARLRLRARAAPARGRGRARHVPRRRRRRASCAAVAHELADEDGAAVAELTLARGETASFVLSFGAAGRVWDDGTVAARVRGDRAVLARLDRAEHATAVAGASSSTARRSRSSCSPTCRPEPSSRRPRRACPSRSAARATGTTATAGCATRPSRCSRSCGSASATRRRRTWAGCTSAATWTSTGRRSRSCTASTAAAT